MNPFAVTVLEISTVLQNIYFEEYVSVAAQMLGCQEIHFNGITRSKSYLINIHCQLLSQSIPVIFTFFFLQVALIILIYLVAPGFSGLYPIVICTIMLTLRKQLTTVMSSNSFLSITSEMCLGLTKDLGWSSL